MNMCPAMGYRGLACATPQISLSPSGGFDVTGENFSSEGIISQNHISLSSIQFSLGKNNPERNQTQKLVFFSLPQLLFLYFLATSNSFQAIFSFKYFSGNLTQKYLNFCLFKAYFKLPLINSCWNFS